jgi:uncharacterized repeat protein (TIGR03803 family)
MKSTVNDLLSVLVTLALILGQTVAADSAQAETYRVLYSFKGGEDGAHPYGGLSRDSAGTLYGTTYKGGAYHYGTVFELLNSGKHKVLYSFGENGGDGEFPRDGWLARDKAGNLYGTTYQGGAYGYGTVFKLDKTDKETVLYSFTGGADGKEPSWGGLNLDAAGNLYGTTWEGGSSGYGTVFKVDKNGVESVVYSFAGGHYGPDGAYPYKGLIRDESDNLYGTTVNGGAFGEQGGNGTVFEVDHTGRETLLYSFGPFPDGAFPTSGLIRDAVGNIYGTTNAGGNSGACGSDVGCGTVFRLDSTGKETILHNLNGGVEGGYPWGALVRDESGTLYGTANGRGAYGYGTVFKLDKRGNFTVLHAFTGGGDGGYPDAGLNRDEKGNLYGTTYQGGDDGVGTVFELTP